MRYFFMAWLLVSTSVASALPIADITCQEERSVFVDPKTLRGLEQSSRTIYRFKAGKMYISDKNTKEYFYNRVFEIEPLRYTSGHKVIQFEDTTPNITVILVHTYIDEVRITRAICSK